MDTETKQGTKRVKKAKRRILKLPRLFPSHTRPDIITLTEWKYKVGDILPPHSDECLLTVECCYGEGTLSIPTFLRRPHRIVEILIPAGATMQLDDPLFVLELVKQAQASTECTA